jgi:hypothetical protein
MTSHRPVYTKSRCGLKSRRLGFSILRGGLVVVGSCGEYDTGRRRETRATVNLTLMRPPPVKRHSSPLNASECCFRAITTSKVHPRPRDLTSFLYRSASRAAAPDTYRGSIAAQAAMAADRSADRGALESLRCPHTVLGNARAERRAFASQDQARGRSSPRVRDDRLLSISSSRWGCPHNAQGSRNLGAPPERPSCLWDPANEADSPMPRPSPRLNVSRSNIV